MENKYVLRPVVSEDIEFIYFLRSLSSKGFLKEVNRPTNHSSITSILNDTDGQYLAYESENEIVGYYRFSLKTSRIAEIGSWITNPTAIPIRKVLMDVEFKNYIFKNTDVSLLTFNVNNDNHSVIRHHINYGAEIVKSDSQISYLTLEKSKFYRSEKIIYLFEKYRIV